MSHIKQEATSTKFTKREWIHLIITLSILQAAIWFISYFFAGSSNALGYVSFAGTLISIILAVLAIGYTYGESHQQKNTSNTLANQIDSLIEIKNELKIQADSLSDIKNLKDSLKIVSEKMDNHFNETNSKLTVFTEKVGISVPNNTSSEGISDAHMKLIFSKLFIDKDYKVNVISFILVILFFEGRQNYNEAPFVLKFLKDLNLSNLSEEDAHFMYGAAFQMALILERFGFLRKDLHKLDDLSIDYFNYVVNEKFEELKDELGGGMELILNLAKKSTFYRKV